jgi:prepilin-type N-terminal cleavage/methylation domain-containing protein
MPASGGERMSRTVPDDGFTLVELMVVVLIVGILVSIVVVSYPTVVGNAQEKACFASERTVDGMWVNQVLTGPRPDPYPTDWTEALVFLVPKYLKKAPVCPAGGIYTWEDDHLSCSVHGRF